MSLDNINEVASRDEEAHRLYRMASDAMLARNPEAAVALFEQSNRLCPHYKTCLELGRCLVVLDRHFDAVIPLAAATALNRQGIAPFELARVYLSLGDPTRSYEFIRLAIERQPDLKCAHELEPVIREAVEKYARTHQCD